MILLFLQKHKPEVKRKRDPLSIRNMVGDSIVYANNLNVSHTYLRVMVCKHTLLTII